MLVMGFNRWEKEGQKKALILQSLKWSEDLKSRGIAELRGAWISGDKKVMWCYWETEKLEALQKEFDGMYKQTSLASDLSVVEEFFPTS